MNHDSSARVVEILLVEDNPGDVMLTQAALEDGRFANRLHVARDGDEALAFLRGIGRFADAPRPDMVLLDINLPRIDGHEILQQIKSDPDLKTIPVIMLTTSSAESDVYKSYALAANAYIVKPVDLEQFVAAIRSLEQFWMAVVRLPGR